jgi:hypothetical protein
MALAKPNLFIVGASKCGTTAWAKYLSLHPDIFFSHLKEPHFFSTDFPRHRRVSELSSYLALFGGRADEPIIAEASASYLKSREAPDNLRSFNSDSKILIFVRDRPSFIRSWHNELIKNGTERIEDLEAAWRLSGRRDAESAGPRCKDLKFLDYEMCGRFGEQVERYFEMFPAAQIRVFHFRDWTQNPRGAYQDILRFLELPDDGRTEFPIVNKAATGRLRWLTPLLRNPPRFMVRAAAIVKQLAGVESLGIIRSAKRLNSRSGYTSELSDALKNEIQSHYADDEALLESYLWRPSEAVQSPDLS